MKRIVLIILYFFLYACGSKEYNISEAEYNMLPFDVESNRVFQIDDPIITLYYDIFEDSAVINGGIYFVSDQKQPEIAYPMLLDYPAIWIPFISDILYYDSTGKVVFKLKKPFEKNSFAIHYIWNSLKIPNSFPWPADFDNIYLCTNRYYDLYLTLNLSSRDLYRAAEYINKKGINTISKEWDQFFNEIDPETKIVLSRDSFTMPLKKDMLFQNNSANYQKVRHFNQEPKISHTLFMPQDKTKEHLSIDSLILYVPKTKTKHQYVFSNSIIKESLHYPFFQAGMNCFALEILNAYSLDQVSKLISEDEHGALYYVPEEYNQHSFPIYARWSENDSSFFLITRLNNGLDIEALLNEQSTTNSLSMNDAEDSIFVFANQLIASAVDSGKLLL